MRAIKYYPPESRRFLHKNLQCIYCGNTHAFFIDLRLRHQVIIQDDSSILVEPSKATEKIFHSIAQNIGTVIDNENEVINCANCKNSSVDIQERLLDYCWQTGCPGCDVCGSFIDKDEVIDICIDCLKENDGKIEEEECSYQCAYYDNGLEAARNHHGISFEELKREAGY
jgi:hypothetical protein